MSTPDGFTFHPSYDLTISFALMAVGMVIKTFFGGNTTPEGTSGPATSAIWGLGTVLLALSSIFIIKYALASRDLVPISTAKFLKNAIVGGLPIFLIIVIIAWLLSIYVKYYKRINSGKVASEFNAYSRLSTFLIILQLVLLYQYVNAEVRNKFFGVGAFGAGSLSLNITQQKLGSISYIITLLNLIVIGIMQVIIKYFSTDG